jgi:ATP-dependent Clp protease ATP-binding subunit ClpC
METENENIRIAREKLNEIREEKEKLKMSTSDKDYNKIDAIEREEINLQSILDAAIKSYNLDKQPYVVTANDIKETISEKTNIPIKDLSADDKDKLKNLNERIKKIVIGQDEAVDTVCRAIKRQRIGISNPNKPVVFFFGGSTGVGKTFLCKTIAKELWGDEKQMIRLDMSEYSEVTSVTKLYGAPPSYIGYNDRGTLVDKLKEKKHCILLLDEIEKACDKVYNVFLQMFDDGRLTDSKGNTVDCKNIIIIMTSNIAAKQLTNNKPIGFIDNSQNAQRDIIEKELKRHFNPEFLNRIDDIVYFNKLTQDDIKNIILHEIEEIERKINSIGYYFDSSIKDDDFIQFLLASLNDEQEYGARPIKRKLQHIIEDKISNKIIEDDVKIGYFFKKNDFIPTQNTK